MCIRDSFSNYPPTLGTHDWSCEEAGTVCKVQIKRWPHIHGESCLLMVSFNIFISARNQKLRLVDRVWAVICDLQETIVSPRSENLSLPADRRKTPSRACDRPVWRSPESMRTSPGFLAILTNDRPCHRRPGRRPFLSLIHI